MATIGMSDGSLGIAGWQEGYTGEQKYEVYVYCLGRRNSIQVSERELIELHGIMHQLLPDETKEV